MSIETLTLKISTDTKAVDEGFFEKPDITTEFFREVVKTKLLARENEYLSPLSTWKHDEIDNGFPDRSETTTDKEKEVDDLSAKKNQSRKDRKRFRIIQKWEGTVIDVTDDTFMAELKAITGEEDELIAEIFTEEVDEDDLSLVTPGAVFYWSIGYLQQPSGTMRVSIIRFRRLPPWRKRQLQKARTEANKLQALLDVN